MIVFGMELQLFVQVNIHNSNFFEGYSIQHPGLEDIFSLRNNSNALGLIKNIGSSQLEL